MADPDTHDVLSILAAHPIPAVVDDNLAPSNQPLYTFHPNITDPVGYSSSAAHDLQTLILPEPSVSAKSHQYEELWEKDVKSIYEKFQFHNYSQTLRYPGNINEEYYEFDLKLPSPGEQFALNKNIDSALFIDKLNLTKQNDDIVDENSLFTKYDQLSTQRYYPTAELSIDDDAILTSITPQDEMVTNSILNSKQWIRNILSANPSVQQQQQQQDNHTTTKQQQQQQQHPVSNLITPNITTDNTPDQLQALLYYIYLTSVYLAVQVRSVTPLCITTLPYQQQFSQPTPGTLDAQQQHGQQQQHQQQRPPSLPPYSSARQQQLAQHFNLFLTELSTSLQPPINPHKVDIAPTTQTAQTFCDYALQSSTSSFLFKQKVTTPLTIEQQNKIPPSKYDIPYFKIDLSSKEHYIIDAGIGGRYTTYIHLDCHNNNKEEKEKEEKENQISSSSTQSTIQPTIIYPNNIKNIDLNSSSIHSLKTTINETQDYNIIRPIYTPSPINDLVPLSTILHRRKSTRTPTSHIGYYFDQPVSTIININNNTNGNNNNNNNSTTASTSSTIFNNTNNNQQFSYTLQPLLELILLSTPDSLLSLQQQQQQEEKQKQNEKLNINTLLKYIENTNNINLQNILPYQQQKYKIFNIWKTIDGAATHFKKNKNIELFNFQMKEGGPTPWYECIKHIFAYTNIMDRNHPQGGYIIPVTHLYCNQMLYLQPLYTIIYQTCQCINCFNKNNKDYHYCNNQSNIIEYALCHRPMLSLQGMNKIYNDTNNKNDNKNQEQQEQTSSSSSQFHHVVEQLLKLALPAHKGLDIAHHQHTILANTPPSSQQHNNNNNHRYGNNPRFQTRQPDQNLLDLTNSIVKYQDLQTYIPQTLTGVYRSQYRRFKLAQRREIAYQTQPQQINSLYNHNQKGNLNPNSKKSQPLTEILTTNYNPDVMTYLGDMLISTDINITTNLITKNQNNQNQNDQNQNNKMLYQYNLTQNTYCLHLLTLLMYYLKVFRSGGNFVFYIPIWLTQHDTYTSIEQEQEDGEEKKKEENNNNDIIKKTFISCLSSPFIISYLYILYRLFYNINISITYTTGYPIYIVTCTGLLTSWQNVFHQYLYYKLNDHFYKALCPSPNGQVQVQQQNTSNTSNNNNNNYSLTTTWLIDIKYIINQRDFINILFNINKLGLRYYNNLLINTIRYIQYYLLYLIDPCTTDLCLPITSDPLDNTILNGANYYILQQYNITKLRIYIKQIEKQIFDLTENPNLSENEMLEFADLLESRFNSLDNILRTKYINYAMLHYKYFHNKIYNNDPLIEGDNNSLISFDHQKDLNDPQYRAIIEEKKKIIYSTIPKQRPLLSSYTGDVIANVLVNTIWRYRK